MDKKFKIFVIVALVVLTLAVGAGVFFIVQMQLNSASGDDPTEVVVSTNNKKVELELMAMTDAVNGNLKIGKDGIAHIMRISISIQINVKSKVYKDFQTDFPAKETIVRDRILRMIRNITYEEIMQPGAQEAFAESITDMINELLETDIVFGTYFQEFFVQ